ncbi:MAG: hypothetical protein Q8880_06575, partial [Bacteroidota bacterium]|nr:hypothetical protein [Bacteroidota bacterium]
GDSLGGGTFELNYLNPVIFLRPLESNIGSPDNAMIGIDFKFNFLKHFLLYGQIFIDEFVIDEIRHYNNGSWKNKEALQLGLKYIDVAGVSNLDYQIETNLATPYTYSHMSNFTSYTNFDQPLANPLGANFYEVINIIRYQPIPRLNLNAKSIISVIGYDDQTHFWGNDITRSYLTRVMDYENKLAQGNRATLYYTELSASYQIMHNLFADLSVIYRNQTSDVQRLKSKMTYTSLGIRWNIAKRRNEF